MTPGAGSGPYSVDFQLQDAGGAINAALLHKPTDTYLPITGWTTSVPCSTALVTATSLGDVFGTLSQSCTSVPVDVHIDFADPGVDAADLCLIFTAMGNYPSATNQDDNERVDDVVFTYTPAPTALGTCCQELGTPGAVGSLMTGIDTTPLVWMVEGNSVCAFETAPGQAALYGDLVLCSPDADEADCTVTPTIVPA